MTNWSFLNSLSLIAGDNTRQQLEVISKRELSDNDRAGVSSLLEKFQDDSALHDAPAAKPNVSTTRIN